MNYPESKKILEEIKKAKKILVNLHRYPDGDSFSSAISLYYFLKSLGKNVVIVLSNKTKLSSELLTFPESELVKQVDFSKFDFDDYDLFISPDSNTWQQIVDDESIQFGKVKIPVISIDHHADNAHFGLVNLVQIDASSCTQVLYSFFQDCGYKIDKKVATFLLMGIITDTGGFQYASEKPDVFKITAELISKGADKKDVLDKIFRTKSLVELNGWGYMLDNLKIDKDNKFVWTAMTHETYLKYGQPRKLTSTVAGMFSCIVEDTNFGMVMVQDENGDVLVSFRSRTDFDVSKIAKQLGGGGHKAAAAAKIEKMDFDKAVEKILETARKYAKEN